MSSMNDLKSIALKPAQIKLALFNLHRKVLFIKSADHCEIQYYTLSVLRHGLIRNSSNQGATTTFRFFLKRKYGKSSITHYLIRNQVPALLFTDSHQNWQ